MRVDFIVPFCRLECKEFRVLSLLLFCDISMTTSYFSTMTSYTTIIIGWLQQWRGEDGGMPLGLQRLVVVRWSNNLVVIL
jgi:hypothetical protein